MGLSGSGWYSRERASVSGAGRATDGVAVRGLAAGKLSIHVEKWWVTWMVFIHMTLLFMPWRKVVIRAISFQPLAAAIAA